MLRNWENTGGISVALPTSFQAGLQSSLVPVSCGGVGTVTYTRATAAWAKLATGLWASSGSGAERYDYTGTDTTIGVLGGYLSEGARTNDCLQSRDLTNASWTKGGTITVAKTATGIDGAANSATTVTGGAVAATNIVTQAITLGSQADTFSCFIKRITGTGAISLTLDNVTYTDISGSINSATYTQVQIQQTLANPTVGIKVTTNGDSVAVDMCQMEPGGFMSTPIPTTTVAVARNADVDQYVSSGNVPTNDFCVYGETTWPVIPSAASYYLWSSYVDANNSTSVLWDGTNLIARRRISGTSHDATISLTPVAGTRVKWAARFSSVSGSDIFKAGAIGTNDATTTACQIGTNFQIGADGNGANQPFAMNANYAIYPKALSTAQLKAMAV